MEYLVRSIKKGYYISNESLDKLKNDGDFIEVLLSWEEGNKVSKLKEYFSSLKRSREEIEIQCRKSYNKDEYVDFIKYNYVKDKCLLSDLYETDIIDKELLKELNKMNEEAENKQIVLINNCNNSRKKLGLGFFSFIRKG